MTDNVELDPRKHTFSQSQGYEPTPGPLALEVTLPPKTVTQASRVLR